MSNKVFIARDNDGQCFVYEKRPNSLPGMGYNPRDGELCIELIPELADLFGIPFPEPGEMVEWPPQAQREVEKNCQNCGHFVDEIACEVADGVECGNEKTFRSWVPRKNTEPEPPVEKLVPITSLAQLKVGDKLRSESGDRVIFSISEGSVITSRIGTFLAYGGPVSLKGLQSDGYRQVICNLRTISREEARAAIYEGKTVRSGGWYYGLSDNGDVFVAGRGGAMTSAFPGAFDLPDGQYEIVNGG